MKEANVLTKLFLGYSENCIGYFSRGPWLQTIVEDGAISRVPKLWRNEQSSKEPRGHWIIIFTGGDCSMARNPSHGDRQYTNSPLIETASSKHANSFYKSLRVEEEGTDEDIQDKTRNWREKKEKINTFIGHSALISRDD